MEGQSLPCRPAIDEHSDIPVPEYGLHPPFLEHNYESRQLAKEYDGGRWDLQEHLRVLDRLTLNTFNDVTRRLLLNSISGRQYSLKTAAVKISDYSKIPLHTWMSKKSESLISVWKCSGEGRCSSAIFRIDTNCRLADR